MVDAKLIEKNSNPDDKPKALFLGEFLSHTNFFKKDPMSQSTLIPDYVNEKEEEDEFDDLGKDIENIKMSNNLSKSTLGFTKAPFGLGAGQMKKSVISDDKIESNEEDEKQPK